MITILSNVNLSIFDIFPFNNSLWGHKLVKFVAFIFVWIENYVLFWGYDQKNAEIKQSIIFMADN